ncbi:MAG: hypothetical protein JOZ47_17080 [Kutzneria sp.]|nr:hypothetical protein [Kutzneria sp.]
MATPTPQSIQLRRFVPSIAFNAVVPLLIYTLARPYFTSDVPALIIAGAFPLLLTIGGFVARRKLDVIGVLSVAGFLVAVGAQLLISDDGLIVKVQGTLVTGPIGVIFLLSALVGKPMIQVIFQFLARRNPAIRVPTKRRALAITLILGGMFTLCAVVTVILALSLPTPVFLAVSNPVGLGIVALGFVTIFLLRRKWQAQRDAEESARKESAEKV